MEMKYQVQILLLWTLLVSTAALPQQPLLQFTKDGVRVNWGGYHAEAGLGGLLGQPGAEGQLYAGAGTPWGAQAFTGLGGGVGGQYGAASGGMDARAYPGYGQPGVAAGGYGSVNGYGQPNVHGRTYAGQAQWGQQQPQAQSGGPGPWTYGRGYVGRK